MQDKTITIYRTIGRSTFHLNIWKVLHNDVTISNDVTDEFIETQSGKEYKTIVSILCQENFMVHLLVQIKYHH